MHSIIIGSVVVGEVLIEMGSTSAIFAMDSTIILLLLLLSILCGAADAFSSSSTGVAVLPQHKIISHSLVPQFSSSTTILFSSATTIDDNDQILEDEAANNNIFDNATNINDDDEEDDDVLLSFSESVDKIFTSIDIDGSGTIDIEEYNLALSSTSYTNEAIQRTFNEIDTDGSGTIDRREFQSAISKLRIELQQQQQDSSQTRGNDEDCPMGYWLNSVQQTCQPLGPIGRISQKIETRGPLNNIYKRITNLKPDREAIRKKGVSFALAYSIISNLNGAISLSVAWYITVKRTGISPLVPGQKKSLLTSYAMIYGILQLLKPFRVAAAIAMSKLSAEYLVLTQERLNCSRTVAIGCQYIMGNIMMCITFGVGVSIVSLITGVPIR